MASILTCLFIASLAHAAPKPEAELRKLADEKVAWVKARDEGPDNRWAASDFQGLYWLQYRVDGLRKADDINWGEIRSHKIDSFVARIAPDGQTALVSYNIKVHELVTMDDGGLYTDWIYRVTEIAKKTKEGWRVTTGLWTSPVANDEVNKTAKAGKMPKLEALPAGGDKSLLDAFTKLTTGAFDEAAAKRKDLVAFGSGPKERTVGGAGLAKAWSAAWANKIKVDSVTASNDPKATLGYVIANITLQKKDYTIPFRVMFVFERKTDADPWSVVHAHFAVAEP